MRLCLFFILFFNSILFAQEKYSLKSYDDDYPIIYANIYANNKLITSSDSLGNFKIEDEYIKSKITISAFGYRTIDSVQFKNNYTILMESEAILLNDVVLKNKKKSIKKKLGKSKSGNIGVVCSSGNNVISQVSKFFKNELNGNLYLDRIRFKAICSENDRFIKILIYSVGENGEPNKILNNKELICKLRKGHNTYEVDLNELNIEFQKDGIFIALNYILIEQNKHYRDNTNWFYYEPSLDAVKIENFSDTWYNLNGEWKKSENYSLSMELTLID